MPNSIDVGVDCTVTVAGIAVPANISSTSPSVQRAMRPIVLALGLANNLVGYSPSTSARSGFTVTFDIPYNVTAANLNAMLSTTPYTVAMQFGTAGGVSVANNLVQKFAVSGAEGGNISCALTLESMSLPTNGTTVVGVGAATDVWKFSDFTSLGLISGAVATDVKSFSFDVTRNLARFVGNSTTGIPKQIKVTHTEAAMSGAYLKNGDAEGTAFLGAGGPNYCPTIHDMVALLTQICPSGAPATLTFTATKCFYQDYPKPSGNTEDYVVENVMGQAQQGAFSIA